MAASAPAMSRRIMKETVKLQKDPVPGISVAPFKDNLRYFTVSMEGPSDSPYEGGVFKLEMFLPGDYPLSAPKVRFLTKIWHVNIDGLGRICLDLLKDRWSPALQMRTLLLSIQSLLADENNDDPLNEEAAAQYRKDKSAYLAKAKEWTAKFASS